MLKVLFIGGTGIISTASSALAVEKGVDLYLFNRGLDREYVPEGATVIQGDIRNAEDREKLKNYEFDVVVDWVAFTPDHVQNDIDIFKGRVGQYFFISTASVYQRPVGHYLVTESTPLANPFWEYSRNKISCEELLINEYRKNGFPVTIIRPSFTYGETLIPAALNSFRKSWSLIDRMKKGKKIIVHGDGTALWTMTHNTDFAKGIVGLLGNSQAIGHAFHIVSDEVLSWDQIYNAIGKAAGVVPNIIHIPTDFITKFSPEDVGNLWGDKAPSVVFDNTKIKRFVPEFKATMSFEKGVKESVEWYEAHPDHQVVDEEWDALMDRIVEAYESVFNKY